ncbi:MAG: aminotransferase DegT [Alphaproteobacteria bacterium HGW-Alphaproteobacteria-8]|nr:MAG: aminotransferase DegT [Alphaproteobacteria bacterium HGW-Alphaproteobacteria-8]
MIPITRPSMDAREAEAVVDVIRSGWLSQGEQVAAFEREFAAAVGAPHACAVSNCTTALHLALLACGVAEGDEVVTVSHSFIATANVIRQCGATPVFVDIEAQGFNIDPEAVERAIGPSTKAILCVHQVGMPCDMAALRRIADAHGVALIEDAACAAGSEILAHGAWMPVGAPHGDVACFSFHPRKIITTGEGGMLTTRRERLDRTFRLLRQHGMSIPDTVRHGSPRVTFETYPVQGYNYRMTDLQAAIGRVQLSRLPEIVARRRALADNYRTMIAGIDGVTAPTEPGWARSNWQSYCVLLDLRFDQRRVMQAMLDRGVATRRGIMNAHSEAAHAGSASPGALPRSEAARDRGVILPLFPDMHDDEQFRVVEALVAALGEVHRSAACAVGA